MDQYLIHIAENGILIDEKKQHHLMHLPDDRFPYSIIDA